MNLSRLGFITVPLTLYHLCGLLHMYVLPTSMTMCDIKCNHQTPFRILYKAGEVSPRRLRQVLWAVLE